MAIVILGGLVTSTLLNLLFIPALYWRFAKPRSRMKIPNEMPQDRSLLS